MVPAAEEWGGVEERKAEVPNVNKLQHEVHEILVRVRIKNEHAAIEFWDFGPISLKHLNERAKGVIMFGLRSNVDRRNSTKFDRR